MKRGTETTAEQTPRTGAGDGFREKTGYYADADANAVMELREEELEVRSRMFFFSLVVKGGRERERRALGVPAVRAVT
jgi:hypothetical protein